MSKQDRKLHLGLAGEYFVAAELQRRGITASITFGNAKKADVIAFSLSSQKALSIEVKTTMEDKWVLGGNVPSDAPERRDKLWVFVRIPKDLETGPDYYVLTEKDLFDAIMPGHLKYREEYRARHGKEFEGPGVVHLSLESAKEQKNKWDRIFDRLERDS